MSESSQLAYASYLRKRSALGRFYRNFWLYPRLSRFMQGKVLDVGCGIGDMLAFRKGALGVDINAFNVDFCCARGLDARLMEADRLPFADQSFDSVLLDNVLEHIALPGPLLVEIQRVLRPKGSLLLGVPGRRGQDSDDDHKIYYDEAGLQRLAQASGFTVRKFFHMPLFPSQLLSRVLRQYCLYSVWQVSSNRPGV